MSAQTPAQRIEELEKLLKECRKVIHCHQRNLYKPLLERITQALNKGK